MCDLGILYVRYDKILKGCSVYDKLSITFQHREFSWKVVGDTNMSWYSHSGEMLETRLN